MPHWEEQEVRRGLGYLAWLSQHKGEAEKEEEEEQDKRQVIWSRQEIADALGQLLRGETGSYHGRFRDIKPEQADELLNYYLNPAGLLIEPAEEQIQFTHLSFQEYLCAEYIHGRALAGGSRKFLDSIRDRLYKNLHLPGWDEVGLLLLTIHANQGAQTERTAHLELLAELDPTDIAQAKLLLDALIGKELDYPGEELSRWLPVAVATVLIHHEERWAERLGMVPAWADDESGLQLLKKFFAAEDQVDGLWDILLAELRNNPPEILEHSGLQEVMDDAMRLAWHNFHEKQDLGLEALLFVAVESSWIRPDPERPKWDPIADKEVQQILADWLEKQKPILYQLDDKQVIRGSECSYLLEELLPDQGILWKRYLAKISLNSWLLQGEQGDDELTFITAFSLPSTLLSLYPVEALPENIRLAMGLYQCLQVTEAFSLAEQVYFFVESRIQFLHQLQAQKQIMLELRTLSLKRSHKRTALRAKLRMQSQTRKQARGGGARPVAELLEISC